MDGRTVEASVRSADTATDAGAETDSRIDPRTNDGDHDRFAHYVRKTDILKSAVEGVVIEALCGKRWIPTRNPDGYPICPSCKAIYDEMAP
jgi:hypothetical protein